MGRVYIQLNHDRVTNDLNSRIELGNRLLIEDIYDKSIPLTPLGNTANLRMFVRRYTEDKDGIIEWTVPYASYQNRGMRYDGSHVVKNYTTPGTGAHFADMAVEQCLERVDDYYKGLI